MLTIAIKSCWSREANSLYAVSTIKIEWTQGMWADCGNVNSPVSLGLFEGENKSKYFQKSLPQLCM